MVASDVGMRPRLNPVGRTRARCRVILGSAVIPLCPVGRDPRILLRASRPRGTRIPCSDWLFLLFLSTPPPFDAHSALTCFDVGSHISRPAPLLLSMRSILGRCTSSTCPCAPCFSQEGPCSMGMQRLHWQSSIVTRGGGGPAWTEEGSIASRIRTCASMPADERADTIVRRPGSRDTPCSRAMSTRLGRWAAGLRGHRRSQAQDFL